MNQKLLRDIIDVIDSLTVKLGSAQNQISFVGLYGSELERVNSIGDTGLELIYRLDGKEVVVKISAITSSNGRSVLEISRSDDVDIL